MRPGHCGVQFFSFLTTEYNYDVISTDYDTYTIINNRKFYPDKTFKREYMWILTREPLIEGTKEFDEMERKTYGIITEKLPSFNLDTLKTIKHHKRCKYRKGHHPKGWKK